MSQDNSRTPAAPVGHLSVHIEGEHPADTPFMFERVQRRGPGAAATALIVHAVVGVFLWLGMQYQPTGSTEVALVRQDPPGIIWIAEEGPGGGGGGGGNQMKLPPRKAELPGKDKLTVPVEKPKPLVVPQEEQPPKPPEPIAEIPQLSIPAKVLASGAASLPGTLDGVPGSPSQGPGTGGGAGTGNGTGIGPGQGSGLGPGSGGGTGGGAFRPGSGVSIPRVLREVKPAYTADAMRAKIQGTAVVEAVVLPDGTVGNVSIVKSLDATFGLDHEALKAAKQWKFMPGTRNGQPVPVLVTIELMFTLR